MYSLLRQKREELTAKGIIPVAGENVRGTPVFEDLVSDPPASEEHEQLKLLEMGGPEPPGEMLISPAALKAALQSVSSVRYNQTLCAEHAAFKPWMAQLEGEKTQQTLATLAKIWKVPAAEALSRAEKLSDIGFFEGEARKNSRYSGFRFYRDALHLVQGPAD